MADRHEPPRGGPARPGEPGQRLQGPSGARDTLARAVAPGRKARQRRAVLAASGLLSALVLVLAGTAWSLTSYVNRTVSRVNAGTAGGASGPLTLLVAGVDIRAGLTPSQQRQLHVGHVISTNSDTMMVVHISADRSRVTVVSLPRDSWVDIPGHGMNKINAALGLGGPRLMVATVEHATGLTINDLVEVNFLAFVRIIDALGGVDICVPQAINDSYTGLHLSTGVHHVDGITALKYARDRHSFATSDLARISNQQSLMSSLLKEAISSGTLANPLRLSAFLRSVLSAVTVDKNLNIPALADQLRGISLSHVQFLTVPLSNLNYLTPTGESAVLWDSAAARGIFGRLKADEPLSGHAHTHTARRSRRRHAAPAPAQPGASVTPAGTRTAAQAACH